jgi:hypothetical protein
MRSKCPIRACPRRRGPNSCFSQVSWSKPKQNQDEKTTTIRGGYSSFLDELSILSELLGNFLLQFLDAVLNFLDSPRKFNRVTSITAVGTGITIRFEPADVLLALVTALRTGNLDSFFLEHGNRDFSLVPTKISLGQQKARRLRQPEWRFDDSPVQ